MKLIKGIFIICFLLFIVTGCNKGDIKEEEVESVDTKVHVKRINELTDEVSELETEVTSQDTTIKLLEKRIKQLTDNSKPLDSTAEFELERLGVTSKEIVVDLYNRPDLIPIDGVLGGTMQFSKESIYILNHKWVFATFADGHTGGNAIFEYTVNDDKTIHWKLIDDWKIGEK